MSRMQSAKGREPGMSRPWHWIVLSVCVIVVAVAAGGLYLSDFRSKTAGAAKDLYYSGVDYMVACASGQAEFKPDGESFGVTAITKASTLAPYYEGEIEGDFSVKVSKKREILYVTLTRTKVLFGRYAVRTTQVYPKGSDQAESLEFFKIQKQEPDNTSESSEKGRNEYVEISKG